MQQTMTANDETYWDAVTRRDRAYDGIFYYSVATTGVYCRPSCAARLPLRKNVAFHKTIQDAERAGFRACKRCRPNETSPQEKQAEWIAAACRQIEAAETMPSLNELATAAGLSRYHFHRCFKEMVGVTPKDYAIALRTRRVHETLQQKDVPTVTDALYTAGYQSSGRFYEDAAETLAMKPTAYKNRGNGEEIWFAFGESSLGTVLIAATARGVCAIQFGDDRKVLENDLRKRFIQATFHGTNAVLDEYLCRTLEMVDTARPTANLPLDIRGTAFQQQVWKALMEIPVGKTESYAAVAQKIGKPTAVRAVAQACAHNELAVLIPCHRVVRSDGGLSGYRWGIERKRRLLAQEAI